MSKSKIITGIIILVIFIGLSIAIIVRSPKTTNTISNIQVATTTLKMYTLADVIPHNSASSCWSAINGKVYELTTWIGKHPGGKEAILYLCGKDGTEAFNGQHGGQALPESTLAGFQIGTLK